MAIGGSIQERDVQTRNGKCWCGWGKRGQEMRFRFATSPCFESPPFIPPPLHLVQTPHGKGLFLFCCVRPGSAKVSVIRHKGWQMWRDPQTKLVPVREERA